MGETFVTLWGNIATDPKGLTTAAGVRITKFRLACTASRRDPQTGEFVDGVTSWYSVACWRELAVNAAASLMKGDPVVVYGKQVVREWESDDGKKGTDVSIDAVSVGHDLRRGQASFRRIKRSGAPGVELSGDGLSGDGLSGDGLSGHGLTDDGLSGDGLDSGEPQVPVADPWADEPTADLAEPELGAVPV